jgi:hypothetical protein
LLIESEGPPVEVLRILSGPKLLDRWLLLKNRLQFLSLHQHVVIKAAEFLHPAVYFSGRLSTQGKTPPLNLHHMFEPGFDPASHSYVTTDSCSVLLRFRNERSKPATVANAENKNAVRIDEIVSRERRESRPVSGQFGLKVSFRAISFTVSRSGLIDPKSRETGQLGQSSEDHGRPLLPSIWSLHGSFTQPGRDENNRDFSGHGFWLRNDGPKQLIIAASD